MDTLLAIRYFILIRYPLFIAQDFRYDPYASQQEASQKNNTFAQYTALMELAKIENKTQNLEHVNSLVGAAASKHVVWGFADQLTVCRRGAFRRAESVVSPAT